MKFLNSKNTQNILISISSNNMFLFTIDISTLLHSPIGTVEEFQFSQDIPDDTFEDVICLEPLAIHIKLVRQEYGIQCLLLSVSTLVDVPSNDIKKRAIEIQDVTREFHIKKLREDTDDIEYINDHDATIDLANIINQELLIAAW